MSTDIVRLEQRLVSLPEMEGIVAVFWREGYDCFSKTGTGNMEAAASAVVITAFRELPEEVISALLEDRSNFRRLR